MAPSVRGPETDSWHALEVAALEEALDTGEAGLSPQRVQARLEEYGPNQLEEAPPKSRLLILLGQFRSPLIYILLAAAVVTALLGEYIDTGVILVILGLNALIGFVQEYRAEVSVRALMKRVSPRAHGWRGRRTRTRCTSPRASPSWGWWG
jgi:magnesium-transporting ATPase (P-type)